MPAQAGFPFTPTQEHTDTDLYPPAMTHAYSDIKDIANHPHAVYNPLDVGERTMPMPAQGAEGWYGDNFFANAEDPRWIVGNAGFLAPTPPLLDPQTQPTEPSAAPYNQHQYNTDPNAPTQMPPAQYQPPFELDEMPFQLAVELNANNTGMLAGGFSAQPDWNMADWNAYSSPNESASANGDASPPDGVRRVSRTRHRAMLRNTLTHNIGGSALPEPGSEPICLRAVAACERATCPACPACPTCHAPKQRLGPFEHTKQHCTWIYLYGFVFARAPPPGCGRHWAVKPIVRKRCSFSRPGCSSCEAREIQLPDSDENINRNR